MSWTFAEQIVSLALSLAALALSFLVVEPVSTWRASCEASPFVFGNEVLLIDGLSSLVGIESFSEIDCKDYFIGSGIIVGLSLRVNIVGAAMITSPVVFVVCVC